ncbi:MAG: AMP-binding protein, partial [Thermocrispum sp.]
TGAAARLGADVLLVNTELPAVALGKIILWHDVRLVVCDGEFAGRFADAGFDGPLVQAWPDDAASRRAPSVRIPYGRGPSAPVAWPATGWPASREVPSVALDDLAEGPRQGGWQPVRPGRLVILTSGTTGVPKGVPRQASGLDSAGLGVSVLARMGLRTTETMVVAPPLFHGLGAAFLLIGLLLGDTLVLRRKFDATTVLADVEQHRAAVLVAVPAMLQRLLQQPERPASLRVIFSGAAPLRPALADRVRSAFGPKLYNGYGSSEVGIATIADPQDLAEAPGTVGKAVEGVRVRVVDAAGNDLPTGSVGRLLVGSGMTFQGYTGGGSKEVVGGLMDTGDLGHLDAAGRIFVDGRSDDMIVSGGENVYPQEVEDALARHPDVLEAAVVGVPDEEFGQRLAAFVVPRAGARPSDEELITHLRGLLARYLVPKDYRLLGELPRNATGKVLRSQLT